MQRKTRSRKPTGKVQALAEAKEAKKITQVVKEEKSEEKSKKSEKALQIAEEVSSRLPLHHYHVKHRLRAPAGIPEDQDPAKIQTIVSNILEKILIQNPELLEEDAILESMQPKFEELWEDKTEKMSLALIAHLESIGKASSAQAYKMYRREKATHDHIKLDLLEDLVDYQFNSMKKTFKKKWNENASKTKNASNKNASNKNASKELGKFEDVWKILQRENKELARLKNEHKKMQIELDKASQPSISTTCVSTTRLKTLSPSSLDAVGDDHAAEHTATTQIADIPKLDDKKSRSRYRLIPSSYISTPPSREKTPSSPAIIEKKEEFVSTRLATAIASNNIASDPSVHTKAKTERKRSHQLLATEPVKSTADHHQIKRHRTTVSDLSLSPNPISDLAPNDAVEGRLLLEIGNNWKNHLWFRPEPLEDDPEYKNIYHANGKTISGDDLKLRREEWQKRNLLRKLDNLRAVAAKKKGMMQAAPAHMAPPSVVDAVPAHSPSGYSTVSVSSHSLFPDASPDASPDTSPDAFPGGTNHHSNIR